MALQFTSDLSGRSPHGERGLKCHCLLLNNDDQRSLPARGAWIEMRVCNTTRLIKSSRSPHGERGLKFSRLIQLSSYYGSLPARGAWIEI